MSEVGDGIEVTFTTSGGASVTAQVTTPSGVVSEPEPVAEAAPGNYPFAFELTEAGMWRVQFTASGEVTATEPFWVWAEEPVVPLATAGQVARLFRPLTADEERLVSAWLAQASRMLRDRFPDLDQRISGGELSASLAADAAVQMVLRVVRVPGALSGSGNIRAETTGPFRRDYWVPDANGAGAALTITDADVALITGRPAGAARRPRAGTIRVQAGLAPAPTLGWPMGERHVHRW